MPPKKEMDNKSEIIVKVNLAKNKKNKNLSWTGSWT